jgi:hypothetical protein
VAKSICSVPNCGRLINRQGLCSAHWHRLSTHGDVLADVPIRKPRPKGLNTVESFRYYMPGRPPADGCWEWPGDRHARGYGVIGHGYVTRTRLLAHRVSYEIFHGPISDNLVVRHRCDNPPCVHPDHLEVGTQADNLRDMRERGRAAPPPSRWPKPAAS